MSFKSRLTSPHVRQHFLALVGFTEIPVGYARNRYLAPLAGCTCTFEGSHNTKVSFRVSGLNSFLLLSGCESSPGADLLWFLHVQ